MFSKLKDKLKSWFKTSRTEVLDSAKESKKSRKISSKSEKKAEDKKATKKEPEKFKEKTIQIEVKSDSKEIKDVQKEELEEKKSIFKKLKTKLSFKITEKCFEKIFSDLELILLENNVAFSVIDKIKADLKQELLGLEIKKQEVEEKIKEALKISIESLFIENIDLIEKIKEKDGPFVMVFFGINGCGKTTTIAKLANLLLRKKLSCVLAAADTFRAASIEQLQKHADKLKVNLIKHDYGSDPAAVAFDAIKHAKAHKIKVVLIDTAGRMHTKADLIREMEKIVRINQPDLKIFVAESITGNDATEQAKIFNEAVGIDGIILTKADVDEKGGTAISVSHITGKPILFLGTGQNYEDLEKFDSKKIIEDLGL